LPKSLLSTKYIYANSLEKPLFLVLRNTKLDIRKLYIINMWKKFS